MATSHSRADNLGDRHYTKEQYNNLDEEDSNEEMEAFCRKIGSLKDVTVDLTEIIKSQNKKLQNVEPGLSSTIYRVKASMKQIGNIDFSSFKGWLYYFLASVVFLLLLFIFMFS